MPPYPTQIVTNSFLHIQWQVWTQMGSWKTSSFSNMVLPESLASKHSTWQRKNALLVRLVPSMSPYWHNNSLCLFLLHRKKLWTQNIPYYIWSGEIATTWQPHWFSSPSAVIHTSVLPAQPPSLKGRGSEWPIPHCSEIGLRLSTGAMMEFPIGIPYPSSIKDGDFPQNHLQEVEKMTMNAWVCHPFLQTGGAVSAQ